MEFDPLVSVIVPFYNTGDIICRTIESIKKQDYVNFEVIFVDDGSRDGTPSTVENLTSGIPTFKIIHKANGGSSSARNTGLNYANGDYVIFWDDDDTQPSNALSLYVEKATDEDIDCICAGITRVSKDGTCTELFVGDEITVTPEEALKMWLNEDRISTGPVTKFCKRSLLTKNNITFETGKTNEDLLWTASVLANSKKIKVLGVSLYFYHSRDDSLSNKLTQKSFDVIDNCKKLFNLIEDKFPALTAECTKYCSKRLFNLIVLASTNYANSNYPDLKKKAKELLKTNKENILKISNFKMKITILLIQLNLYWLIR